MFPTLSRDLADRDAAFHQALDEIVGTETHLRLSYIISEQFQNLLLKPMNKLALVGPLVIVIDALNQCDAENLRSIAEVLSTNASSLPTNIRILITCCPDKPLPDLLKDGVYIKTKSIEDDEGSTCDDIRTFIRCELKDYDGLTDSIVDFIVNAAGQRFRFASTVCDALLNNVNGIAIDDLLDQLLTRSSSHVSGFDEAARAKPAPTLPPAPTPPHALTPPSTPPTGSNSIHNFTFSNTGTGNMYNRNIGNIVTKSM